MKSSNKLIGAIVLSTALVSTGVAVMANNETSSNESTSDLTSVLITKSTTGDSFDLKLKNPSEMTGYTITIELTGPVTLNDSCFKIAYKSGNTIVKSAAKKTGDTTIVTIAVTSDESLIKKDTSKNDEVKTFDIGSVYIEDAKVGATYSITNVEFNSVSSTDGSRLSATTIDSVTDITVSKNVSGNTGGSQSTPEFKPHPEDNTPGGGESENDNDTGGGSSSGGGTSKPEEEKPEDYNVQLFSMSGKDRYETSTKISKTGWTSGAKNVVIVNGNEKNMVDGLSATPFATIKDAPLLLSNGKTLPESTISELKRLSPTNVYVIGGTASMPESVVSSIKSNTKATVTRIGGSTRYETSLEIAKQIDKIADVSKVYISSGTGEVDALSIASVAGREKAPILLTNVNSIDNKTYDFIRSESIKDAYFIGGDKKISNSVINQVDKVVSADVSKNRVAGRNRKDTNAAIIKKFYTGSKLNGVVVSKDDVIIDALTVGSFAAKNDMHVVIGRESLSTSQKNVLASKNTEKVYQAGGGVKTSVINNLKELLGTKK